MFSLNTILAATDLTPRSAGVIPRAMELARAHKARVVLVHVVELRNLHAKRFRLAPPREPLSEIRTRLEALAADAPDLEITAYVVEGAPDLEIAQLAQAHEADLLVLGLHKPRRVLDALRLTILERIAQNAQCPVLIAQPLAPKPYRKVLGAVTFAPASASALHVAAHLAPEAELHAIHALQLPLSAKLPNADLLASPEMTEAEMLRQAFMDLEATPPELHLPEIVPGGVHEVLQFRIGELDPDLIVIGSHSGRSQTRLGNYARDLMRAPPKDMLIAKPD